MKPLAGRRVLVTRPREQAEELSNLLAAAGAGVIHAPLISIEPPLDPGPLHEAVAHANDFDWIVFASANAVDAFMRALATVETADADRSPQFCAVGPSTAARLASYDVRADLVPDEASAEGIVAALIAAADVRGTSVLIPRADIGRDHTAQQLSAAGARVTEVIAYRTMAAQALPDEAADALRRGAVDVVTFTSGSAVRAFVEILGRDDAGAALSRTVVAVIGPTTAQAARAAGVSVAIQPAQYSVPALVDAIARHYAK